MALTGPADLADVRRGDVFYWREQDPFSSRFHRATVTDVDPDTVTVTVRIDNEVEGELRFDRHTAQVRWSDGLGRSHLEAAAAQVEADHEAYLAEQELIEAARATAQGPASALGTPQHGCRGIHRPDEAIAAWKHAQAKGDA